MSELGHWTIVSFCSYRKNMENSQDGTWLMVMPKGDAIMTA